MSTKAERGTKRTCQNPECGSRFYDLNRDPVVCPVCETVYALAMSRRLPLRAGRRGEGRRASPPRSRRSCRPRPSSRGRAGGRGRGAWSAIEGEEETAAAEDDETFLEEEEEDGSDMSDIIGGPVERRAATRRT